MKKYISLVLVILLFFVLSSCRSSEIRYLNRLNGADSYTAKIISSNDSYETLIVYDNDKYYMKLSNGDEYSDAYFTVEKDGWYIYTKESGYWEKKLTDIEVNQKYLYFNMKDINIDWFEKDGSVYVLDRAYYSDFFDENEVKVNAIDKVIYEVKGKKLIFTIVYNILFNIQTTQVIISDIGKSTVNLPRVY